MPQICCNKISMGYDKKPALEEVSFDVEEGDYLCIIGENGSGKTTLMKGLLGLMPLRSGTITYGPKVKSNKIGYLPQQTVVQRDFPASVFEVVLSGCLNRRGLRPFYTSAEKGIALKNMNLFNIQGLKYKSYKALSGGQQQRVLLARALCATDKILILDEPVAGLDPIVTAELYQIINKLNKEKGVTVIMVSHDVNAAIQYANKILHLCTSTVFFGSVTDYLNSEPGRRFLRSEGDIQ